MKLKDLISRSLKRRSKRPVTTKTEYKTELRIEVVDDQIVTVEEPDRTSKVQTERRLVNTHSFTKRKPPVKWSKEEKETFEKCFQMYGCDFARYQKSLDRKTIPQLVKYFKRLSRVNN